MVASIVLTDVIGVTEMQPTETRGGFLRLPQVLSLIPISKSALWQRVKDGRFPQPIKLSERVTVWRAADVHAFIEGAGK